MDAVIKERWLAALESGKYRPAKAALKKDDGHCCLGVLCDVLDPNGWEPSEIDAGFYNAHYNSKPGAEFLSMETLDDIGLRHEDQKMLARYNDESWDRAVKKKEEPTYEEVIKLIREL